MHGCHDYGVGKRYNIHNIYKQPWFWPFGMILTIWDDGNSNENGYDNNDSGGSNLQLSYNFKPQDLDKAKKEIRNTIFGILRNVIALLIVPTISEVSIFSDTY